jgi:hypothetical protein
VSFSPIHSILLMSVIQAGACTRSEKQQALVREQLACASETRFWLLRSPEFPVLDHLWHGAAAEGRPIKWSDYVYLRGLYCPCLCKHWCPASLMFYILGAGDGRL